MSDRIMRKANDDEILADGLHVVRKLRLPPLPMDQLLHWPGYRTYKFFQSQFRRYYKDLVQILPKFQKVLLARTNQRNIKFQLHLALIVFEEQSDLLASNVYYKFGTITSHFVRQVLLRQPGTRLLRRAIVEHYKRRLLAPATMNWMRHCGDITSLAAFMDESFLDCCMRDELQTLALITVRCLNSNVIWIIYKGFQMADNFIANPCNLDQVDFMPLFWGVYNSLSKIFVPVPIGEKPIYDIWGSLVRKIAMFIQRSGRDNPMDSIMDQTMVMFLIALNKSKTIESSSSLALSLIRFILQDTAPRTIYIEHFHGDHSEFVALNINDQQVPLSRVSEADIPTITNKALFRWTVPLLQLIRKEMAKYMDNCTKYIQFMNMILLLIIDCPGVRFNYADPAVTAFSIYFLLRGILRVVGMQAKLYKLHPLSYRWDLGQFLATHNVLKCFRERLIKKLPLSALPVIMATDEAFLAELDQLLFVIQGHFLESELCLLASIHEEYAAIDISNALTFDCLK